MGVKSKKQLITKPCTNCYAPQYIKFNFSYIVYEENFEEKYKLRFLEKMRELSADTYNVILNIDKKIELEFLENNELGIRKQVPHNFSERFESKEYNNKLAIMRLYSNNNPIVARVIGVVIRNIFYVFFIDIGGKLYSHD